MSPLVIALTIGITIVGFILVVLAAKLIKSGSALHDIVRDIGIAFVIAAIVSTMYELNSRSIFDLDRLQGVLKTVLASNVPPNVWDQVNREILQKQVIRRNVDYRVSLLSEPTLPEYQRVLKVSFAYDLYGLGPNKIKYSLSNELGSLQLRNSSNDFPKFESVTVGNIVYQGDELAKLVSNGRYTIQNIQVGPAEPIHIEVVRFEIIYAPGNYDIAMSELTDSLRVHIDTTHDFSSLVKIWSDKGSATLSPAGDMWFFNGVMFPGQELSIQFAKNLPVPAKR